MVLITVNFLNAYGRCIVCPTLLYLGYVFRPWISPLLVFVWCPQLLQNWRYSGSAIDHSRNPTHQAKTHGTIISLERSCWFFNMLYWEVLAIWWPFALVCSLLLTGDNRRQVQPLTPGGNNCWISNRSTEWLCSTERRCSHCRTIVARKRNGNFFWPLLYFKSQFWLGYMNGLEQSSPDVGSPFSNVCRFFTVWMGNFWLRMLTIECS